MKQFEKQRQAPKSTEEIHISDDEVEEVETPPKPTRGRGSRGGVNSRASTSRRRARAK